MLLCLESYSEPGSKRPNEDAWGAGESFAFVLDGATDLGADTSAACDFTKETAAALLSMLPEESRSLSACLEDAMVQIRAASVGGSSSASALLVRCLPGEEALELLCLGDCTLLHRHSRSVFTLSDKRVAQLDHQVLARMGQLAVAQGLTHRAARALPSVRQQLVENRSLRNQNGGYWILDASGAGIAHAKTLRLPVSSGDSLLLMSDGFAAALDYGLYEDEAALLDACQALGLSTVGRRLAQALEQDAEFSRYPRLKPRDDATAVFCRVV